MKRKDFSAQGVAAYAKPQSSDTIRKMASSKYRAKILMKRKDFSAQGVVPYVKP